MELSAMRLEYLMSRARMFAAAAAILAMSVSAFGQTGQLRLSTRAAVQAAIQAVPAQQGESVRRLSIDDAARLALEQNLGIRIQRFDPQIQDTGVALARSSWAPQVTSSLNRNSQTQQPTSSLAGGATSILNGSTQTQLGMNQLLPWGGSYTATWNNSRFTTTNLFNAYS